MAALAALAPEAASARVVIVGVDGASWNVIDPMVARGELPNFAKLLETGVHAELETVEPLTSPVVWTSIATGRTPESHGITDFYGSLLRVKTPTAFERLAASGRRVGLYDFLMTWPPASFPNGFVIPGWLRRDDAVVPEDVWTRVAPLTPFVADYSDLRSSADYLALAQREVELKAPRFIALSDAFDLDVAATTFYAADMTSHRFWRDAFPDQFETSPGSEPEAAHPEAIADALKGIDRSLGQILAAQRPGDTLIVVSDHGFRAHDEPRDVWVTSFRELAARAGLEDGVGFSVQSVFGAVIVRVHRGDFETQEALLERLVAFFDGFRAEDGTPLLPLNLIDVAERPEGFERPLLEQLRQWATSMVVEYWFEVTVDDNAHAVMFAFPNGEALRELAADAPIEVAGRTVARGEAFTREVFTGAHDPVAIFLAAGGPIARLPERGRVSVLDVAPLVHYLAGDRIPDDLDGRLPAELLDPAALAERPVEVAPAAGFAQVPRPDDAGQGASPDDLTEKLRALGYIE